MKYTKHPTSVIDDKTQIGDYTKIWHYSHVSTGVKIGRWCILGQNTYIGKNVIVGDNVKIQNNVSIYEGVTIEDDVFIGPSVVFTNVINPRSFIERKDEFKPTLVKQGASIGANATILCGVTVGEYAMVGAGAVVTKDVPDYTIVVGNPAKKIGVTNQEGDLKEKEKKDVSKNTDAEL
jgi:UDP-2-acetamido-3-amino-2,3-dideoxy-glucuronate N-acetyltransferase